MKLKNLSVALNGFSEAASDSLCGRRSFLGKMFGLMTLCFVFPRFAFAAPTQYEIVECGPEGPPTPPGKPVQAHDENGYWWYDPSTGDQYNTPTSTPPTNPPGLKPIMNNHNTPDCGNAGTSCSDIIDKNNDKCCDCPTGACPDPLEMAATGWMSCCSGAEYVYKDCCGKDPSKPTCPAECYKLPPSTQQAIAECKEGSEAAPVQGWCSAGKDAYCTPTGVKTGKCCNVTS